MPKYSYVALNDQQKTITGSLEAADRAAVNNLLSRQGFRPISIKQDSKGAARSIKLDFLTKSKKVKSDDLVLFTRQLSAMIGAGVSLLRALSSLQQNSESPALKSTLSEIIKDVEGGANFADALAKFPDVFNDVYVNMVRAGESAGILDDILKRLAAQQEKNATMRKKIKSAMAYPMVLVGITILAFFGLMLFVIPNIGSMLTDLGGPDAQLPAITMVMLAISDFMINFWFILIPVLVGSVVAAFRYIKTDKGKKKFHQLTLRVPGVNT